MDRKNLLPEWTSNNLKTLDPNLSEFCYWIPTMTLEWRKAFLTVCQVGQGRMIEGIKEQMKALYGQGFPRTTTSVLSHKTIFNLVDYIASSVFNRSFCAMALKSFPSDGFLMGEVEDALKNGVLKEIHAGMNTFKDHQVDGYGCIAGGDSSSIPGIPDHPRWKRQSESYVQRIAFKIDKLGIIFPKLQRVKNVSRETCANLENAGYRKEGVKLGSYDYTTLDLELFYARTGIKIGGVCEMRTCWKFNDLKPRVYYCQGGTLYWKARYMRPIAELFMDSWPMTHKTRRRFPDELSRFMDPDEIILYWDMTSFTTTLSELKYFLFWLARSLEFNLIARQHLVKTFDYYRGVESTPIWQLIDDYNDSVNILAEYSIERVHDLIGWSEEFSPIITMMNNGPLGVLGNIGFSTVQHSFHCGILLDQNKGVGVGDDHLGLVARERKEELLDHMAKIGVIHPEKVGEVGPIMEYDVEGHGKFLKRGLRRDDKNFRLDILFNFPFIAFAYGEQIPGRTVDLKDRVSNKHKFAGQVGAMLWSLSDLGNLISDFEMKVLGHLLQCCYLKVGWSRSGHLPGNDKERVMNVCVPPIQFELCDPRQEDWAEWLWMSKEGQYISLPMKVNGRQSILHPFYKGDIIERGEDRFMKALQDIGLFKKKGGLREILDVNEANYRKFKKWLSGGGYSLCEFECIRDIPVDLAENFICHGLIFIQSEFRISHAMYGFI
jgi:hypothetical protein